jgi:hypothetical protein
MSTDDILATIDRSLVELAIERARLLDARARLVPEKLVAPPANVPTKRRRGRATSRRGDTAKLVLEALDTNEARTAGEVAKATGVSRGVAGATLIRLVNYRQATKADRGYLRAT